MENRTSGRTEDGRKKAQKAQNDSDKAAVCGRQRASPFGAGFNRPDTLKPGRYLLCLLRLFAAIILTL
jgi:hypothetical protein